MNEKDVLRKLNILKEIKPATDWKTSAREVLLSRLENSSSAVKIGFFEEAAFEIKNFFSVFAQPAFAVMGVFALVACSVFGANAAKNTRPGDSFYAARVWSQKARVAVTMDKQTKAKLEMKYASARAKEITQVLTDPSLDSASDKKKVERLAEDLKAEIKIVTDKYEEINKINEDNKVASAPADRETASSMDEDNVAVGIGRPNGDGAKVFAADSSKASSGIQISQSALTPAELGTSAAGNVGPVATTSEDTDLKKNLSDAVASIDTQDYAAAKDILEQIDVDEIINKMDQGEVKGASESATSVSEFIGIGTVSSSQEER